MVDHHVVTGFVVAGTNARRDSGGSAGGQSVIWCKCTGLPPAGRAYALTPSITKLGEVIGGAFCRAKKKKKEEPTKAS